MLAEETRFRPASAQWKNFQEALDAPVQPSPALRRLRPATNGHAPLRAVPVGERHDRASFRRGETMPDAWLKARARTTVKKRGCIRPRDRHLAERAEACCSRQQVCNVVKNSRTSTPVVMTSAKAVMMPGSCRPFSTALILLRVYPAALAMAVWEMAPASRA